MPPILTELDRFGGGTAFVDLAKLLSQASASGGAGYQNGKLRLHFSDATFLDSDYTCAQMQSEFGKTVTAQGAI